MLLDKTRAVVGGQDVSLYREWSIGHQQVGVKLIGCHMKVCSENEMISILDLP
jgi:hypothetical protein